MKTATAEQPALAETSNAVTPEAKPAPVVVLRVEVDDGDGNTLSDAFITAKPETKLESVLVDAIKSLNIAGTANAADSMPQITISIETISTKHLKK